MKLTGENRSTRGKTCPSATLSTTNPKSIQIRVSEYVIQIAVRGTTSHMELMFATQRDEPPAWCVGEC
jgi:hypothetical protein